MKTAIAGLCPLLLISVLKIADARAANVNADDPQWGCYDALPGHPTDAEKLAFITTYSSSAQAIEAGGGPPAAGILAMGALESGFGWTRAALFANNLFGWKYTSTLNSRVTKWWALACQPASDPNNRYIVFRSGSDSLRFVADRLTNATRYSQATNDYHLYLSRGLPYAMAVSRWVHAIAAAGYNPNKAYPGQVMSIANSFLQPSKTFSPTNSLEGAPSESGSRSALPVKAVPLTNSQPTSVAANFADTYLRKHLTDARYMSMNCGDGGKISWPNYGGRPVKRCTYTVSSNGKTLTALVYLLDPTEQNIVQRISLACRAINLGDHPACGQKLAAWIIENNGGQFPVAGFVIERKQDAGGSGPDPVYLEFRDGNTIDTTDHLNFTDRQLTVEMMEHAARAPISSTRIYARISNATRYDYRLTGGAESVGQDPRGDTQNRWPALIRENELRAQDTGNDELLRGVAIEMRNVLSKN